MLKKLQKGLSLVELMISLTVGSIITVGIVQLFGANSDTYNIMLGQSRMQESARFALDFIRRDLQKAGYRGCFSNNEQLYFTASNPDVLPYEFDIRFGTQGYDAVGVGLWTPTLDDIPDANEGFIANTGVPKADIVSGTDVITFRNITQQDPEIRLAVPMPTSKEDIIVVPPVGGIAGLGFGQMDIAILHDCEKATVFHATAINDTANAPNITIEHSLTPTDVWRNSFQTLAIKNTFEEDAVLSGIETHIYFIAPGAGENSSGDTPLSLWRKSGVNAPVELVEGVEDLQILYGISTDEDLTPNRYVDATGVADWKDVVTMRVTVTTNTIDDVGGSMTPTHTCAVQTCYAGEDPVTGIDGLMRRSFTQTFMMRNKS